MKTQFDSRPITRTGPPWQQLISRSNYVVRAACVAALALWVLQAAALASDFEDYLIRDDSQFHVPLFDPELQGPTMIDVLADGRIVGVATVASGLNDGIGTPKLIVESAFGSRTFTDLGTLDLGGRGWVDFGAAFVQVSPTGDRIAIGDNNGRIGILETSLLPTLTDTSEAAVTWYNTDFYFPFLAKWVDDDNLAFTYFGALAALDLNSPPAAPTVRDLVTGIDGASSDLALDAEGRLYTANGFDFDPMTGSDIGEIRRFSSAQWQSALAGGPAADFNAEGEYFTTYLSASSMEIDAEQNLIVGGADRSRDPEELNELGVFRLSDGAFQVFDPNDVGDGDGDNYVVVPNLVTGEIYAFEPFTVFFGEGEVDNTLIHVISPVPFLLGDMNGDNRLDNFDLQPLEIALTHPQTFVSMHPDLPDYRRRGDINGDNSFDNFDIQPLEILLTSQPTSMSLVAPVPEPSAFALATAGLLVLGAVRAGQRKRRSPQSGMAR